MFSRLSAPLTITLSLLLLLLPTQTSAHGFVRTVTVNNTPFPQNTPNAKPFAAATRQINDVSPLKGANNKNLGCGATADPKKLFADKSINVKAGDNVDIDWAGGDSGNWPHNTGPMLTYLAKCETEDGSCQKFDATQAKWFKIHQIGRKTSGNKEWVQQDLMNGAPATVPIPSNLAAGNYLLRHEIIALHLGTSLGGAEFYPSCTQITVTGNGNGQASGNELVSFPGAYKDNDKGIFFPDAFNPNADYPFPGPRVAALVASSSSNSNSTASPAAAAAASPSGAANSTSESSSTSSSKGACHKKRDTTRPRHISRVMRHVKTSSPTW
ncbi:hypothetical protein PC9H_002105 [Pleurotus ostreatus]|uniref:lytic cellulose monooxygenase (C4-dehydrogenating) n=1 Tax=Pleurotus ostreatus TaxID=5322 RepID=A0A8H6ZKQ1_PLEOS|nr:uncharacterized protein PC9H_002105 [Pleurotus ostreatus]KAF7419514.1 hypothetical protein PC9H_002105 [Pleurotus ostreatus]KAJ8689654.1 hypothetical protein PTI98_012535 [Pleurotus ostreatus]